MELGLPGTGVPGYRLVINRVQRSVCDVEPDTWYLPRTVGDGHPGQCMMIPGFRGVSGYQLELGDIHIHQDCQVQIAFDAKVGPDETGTMQPASRYHLDFRCMPNALVGEKYYPMLKAFGFDPTQQWQHFSVTYPVSARTNFLHALGCDGCALASDRSQRVVSG
jgi:hypothetical protein